MLIEICIRRLGYIATNDDGQELPARRCVLLSSELRFIDSTTIHRLKTSARSSYASHARSTAPRIWHSAASCWYSSVRESSPARRSASHILRPNRQRYVLQRVWSGSWGYCKYRRSLSSRHSSFDYSEPAAVSLSPATPHPVHISPAISSDRATMGCGSLPPSSLAAYKSMSFRCRPCGMFLPQMFRICKCQPCQTTKSKDIPNPIQSFVRQSLSHQRL